MPFPNEHAARQLAPVEGAEFRRVHPEGWPEGIDAIFQVQGEESAIQSIRADRKKWSVEDFERWLKDGGFKKDVEVATRAEKGVVTAEGAATGLKHPDQSTPEDAEQQAAGKPPTISESKTIELDLGDLPLPALRKLSRAYESQARAMKAGQLVATAIDLSEQLAPDVAKFAAATLEYTPGPPELVSTLRGAANTLSVLASELSAAADVDSAPVVCKSADNLYERVAYLGAVLGELPRVIPHGPETVALQSAVEDAQAAADAIADLHPGIAVAKSLSGGVSGMVDRESVYKAAAIEGWQEGAKA